MKRTKMRFLVGVLIVTLVLSACAAPAGQNEVKLPYTFEGEGTRSGSWVRTIERYWVVTNIADLPEAGGIRDDGLYSAPFYAEDGSCDSLQYPDELLMEDGSFAGGAYLLMVEITITNIDAVNWCVEDLDERGIPKGAYPDPYTTGAGISIARTNLETRDPSYAYSSELYSVKYEGACGREIRVLPGETKTVIVGFFVGEDHETSEPYELSKLYIYANGTKIPLGEE